VSDLGSGQGRSTRRWPSVPRRSRSASQGTNGFRPPFPTTT
jgi:hypothetical protein